MSNFRVNYLSGTSPLQIKNPSVIVQPTGPNTLRLNGGAVFSKKLSLTDSLKVRNYLVSVDNNRPNALTFTNQTSGDQFSLGGNTVQLANQLSINDTGSIKTQNAPIVFKIANQPVASINTNGSLTSGPISTPSISTNTSLAVGNMSIAKDKTTLTGPLLINDSDISPVTGDVIAQQLARLSVTKGMTQNIPKLNFNDSFKAIVYVDINDSNAIYELDGHIGNSGWIMTSEVLGDKLDVTITVGPSGQVQFTFGNSYSGTYTTANLTYRAWCLSRPSRPSLSKSIMPVPYYTSLVIQNKGLADSGFSNNILFGTGTPGGDISTKNILVDTASNLTFDGSKVTVNQSSPPGWAATFNFNMSTDNGYGTLTSTSLNFHIGFGDGTVFPTTQGGMTRNMYFMNGPTDWTVYIIDALTNRYLTAPQGTSSDRKPFLSFVPTPNSVWSIFSNVVYL